MGYPDCGHWPRAGRRRRTDECHARLTVRAYLGAPVPARTIGDTDSAPGVGPFDLVTTRPHFGGERHWFRCPGCRRRCRVLYRPEAGEPWRCRRCHRLAYRSAQEAHRAERLWVAEDRILAYLKANGGWGDDDAFEGLLGGLEWREFVAVFMVLVHWDGERIREDLEALEAERRARGTKGPFAGGPDRLGPNQ